MVEIHYVAGLLALLAGFVALFAPKGGYLHRRSGRVFVGAMVVMLGLAAVMALFVVNKHANGVGALLVIHRLLIQEIQPQEGPHPLIERLFIDSGAGRLGKRF